jgi:hypothetical protein
VDQKTTIWQKLAGRCKDVFGSEDSKARYDNSRAKDRLREIDPLIESIGGDGFITAEGLDFLVRQARSRGVAREETELHVHDIVQRRKWRWMVADGTKLVSDDLRTCGGCGRLATEASAKNCGACGKPLHVSCPRCKVLVPTEYDECRSCGFHTGDLQYVEDLLRRGRERLETADFMAALECFEAALRQWGNWEPAVQARQEARKRQAALQRVESLLKERKGEAAEAVLQSYHGAYSTAGTANVRDRIASCLREAAKAYEHAETLRREGRAEDSFEYYQRALSFCSDFQPAFRALTTLPPPPPPQLEVTTVAGGLRLNWGTPPARGALRYRILRKANGTPAHARDGALLGEVSGTRYDDVSPTSGIPWYYAVFTEREGISSTTAASSGPHLTVADVRNVQLTPGDRTIALTWLPPDGCTRVEVWRGEGREVIGPADGTRVHVQGRRALDVDLENGTAYGYLIVAVFPDPTEPGAELRSPGVRHRVVAAAPPPPVRDLRVRRENGIFLMTWSEPTAARVEVRCTTIRPSASAGQVFSLADVGFLGAPVSTASAGRARATLSGEGEVFLTPLSIAGDTAVVGETVCVTALDDITELAARSNGWVITLTWNWPPKAREVLVCYSHDRFPSGPTDPRSHRVRVTRQEYQRHGCWEMRSKARTRHYFMVFVKADGAEAYSSGVGVCEAMGQQITVTYRLAGRGGLLGWGRGNLAVELECGERNRLTGLQIVGKRDAPPLSPRDGILLAAVDELRFEKGKAQIDIPPEHHRSGLYVKLFFQDAAQSQELRLLPGSGEELRLD